MQKKIKIGLGLLVVGIILIGGWFVFDKLEQDNNSFTYVNDKLKNKLGEEITYTGIARMAKGYYIEHSPKELYCLFIEDRSLLKTFLDGIDNEITIKGTVEKKITDYGDCTALKQQCGKHLEYCINVKEIDYTYWHYGMSPFFEFPLPDDVDSFAYQGSILVNGEFIVPTTKIMINKTDPNFKRLYSLLSKGINNHQSPTIEQRTSAFDIIINLKSGQKIAMTYFGWSSMDGEIRIKDQGIYLPNNYFHEFLIELAGSIEKIETVQKLNSIAFFLFEKNYLIALTGEIKEPEPYNIWEDYLFISFKDETGDTHLILNSTDKIYLKKGQRISIVGKVVDFISAGFVVEDASVKILSEEK